MDRVAIRLVLLTGILAAALASAPVPGIQGGRALAEPPDANSVTLADERAAFAAAKADGSAEAWGAFLAVYSSGPRAELARAFLKELSGKTAGAPAAAPSPAAPAAAAPSPDAFPVVAGSWGGIVRDGPGKSYRKIGVLKQGQQVTLTARTDVVEDGFPWFKIAYAGGGTGYQWGGILCSTGDERPDLSKTCPTAPAGLVPAAPLTVRREVDTTGRCASGRVLVGGVCIERRVTGVYNCAPGFRLQGNRCVRDAQPPAAEVPPPAEQDAPTQN